MKNLKIALIALVLSVFCFAASSPSLKIQTRLAKEKDLSFIMKESRTDSLLMFERQTSMIFHKLLNEYRVKNNLRPLEWSDVLWVTARNHNIYMASNKSLTHYQTKGQTKFTGESPSDRLKYVKNKDNPIRYNAENCYYSSWQSTPEEIAKEAFEIWKDSPGHNSNMLNKTSKIHGVAFLFGSLNYGTDLFGY